MEKIFKNLIITGVALNLLFAVIVFVFPEGYLPESLQAIDDANYDRLFESESGVFVAIGYILLSIAVFVSYYLIYKFKKIGRTIFLILILLSFPLLFHIGPDILHPIDSSIYYLIALTDGALLLLMYAFQLFSSIFVWDFY